MIIAIIVAQLAMPCWMVRGAVANYGEQAALQWARQHGYSEKQIEDIKRECLSKPH